VPEAPRRAGCGENTEKTGERGGGGGALFIPEFYIYSVLF